MMSLPNYASIAIVEVLEDNRVAIEAVAVTQDICELAGAWLLEAPTQEQINEIIGGRLTLFTGNGNLSSNLEVIYSSASVRLSDFISEAKRDADLAILSYEQYMLRNQSDYAEYMAVKPVDRKLIPKVVKKQLIAPEFFSWPEISALKSQRDYLTKIGKLSEIDGTAEGFQNVLTTARLVKFFIEKWRLDELERLNRLYVLDQASEITILPSIWLSKVTEKR